MINLFQRYRIIYLILLWGTAMIVWVLILLSPNPENPTQRPTQRQASSSVLNRV